MSLLPELDFIGQRVAWLAERGYREGDVMMDENGEYIMVRTEHEFPDESTYNKVYLPVELQTK